MRYMVEMDVEWTSRWRFAFEGRALKVMLIMLRMTIKQQFKNRTLSFEASALI
uniref:Uncharacterized protein n=1 Tax=Helianthus annuus TaxID=4232 RepID=A0A251UAK3_HELAN